jgi:hypothetical protein
MNHNATLEIPSRTATPDSEGSQPDAPTGARNSLAEQVTRALTRTGYRCARQVQVAAIGNCIVVRGDLPSYYAKQFVLATVLKVPGVRRICDVINVVRR